MTALEALEYARQPAYPPDGNIIQLVDIKILTAVELETLVWEIDHGWPYYDGSRPLPCSRGGRKIYNTVHSECREQIESYTRTRQIRLR
jgi:hypothetical protein